MAETKNFGATTAILQYFRQNPDVVIPYKEIEHELGLPNFTVSNSIGYLVNSRQVNIERPIRGMAIYHSGAIPVPVPAKEADLVTPFKQAVNAQYGKTPSRKIYELIGNADTHEIIRDETDQLFVAVPLLAFINER
jgi:hypothetical protein